MLNTCWALCLHCEVQLFSDHHAVSVLFICTESDQLLTAFLQDLTGSYRSWWGLERNFRPLQNDSPAEREQWIEPETLVFTARPLTFPLRHTPRTSSQTLRARPTVQGAESPPRERRQSSDLPCTSSVACERRVIFPSAPGPECISTCALVFSITLTTGKKFSWMKKKFLSLFVDRLTSAYLYLSS